MSTTTGHQSPSRIVRWGVIGTGTIAAAFASDIRLARNAELAAVCSRTEASAIAFARRFDGIRAISALPVLVCDPSIDAVYIASPNAVHFEQARQLIDAGKSVLVEKPLAISSAQARQIAALASEKGVFAMEALWTLYLPALQRVRGLLAEHAIGPITGVRAELAFERAYDEESRFFAPALGGGSLLDLGLYPIALTIALFGAPRTVEGSWRSAPTGVDFSAKLFLGYDAFEAQLSCGFDRNGGNRFIIEGKQGVIVIDAPFLKASRVIVTTTGTARRLVVPKGDGRLAKRVSRMARALPLPGLKVWPHIFPGYGLQFEIEAASSAIAKGRQEDPRMPLRNSIAALEIIDAILTQPSL